jgi:hypothetical protein
MPEILILTALFSAAVLRSLALLRPTRYIAFVSLAEIKTAVDALSLDELTDLAVFIRERDNAAWDRQIDSDFSENGRLSSVAEEVREDIRAGRLKDLP